jgi:hypothetical protein
MSPFYKILFTISTISDFLPLIPFAFIYKKLDKAYQVYFYALFIGAVNDSLGLLKITKGLHFNFNLIYDLYEIVAFIIILWFFYILNKQRHKNRYYIVLCVGLVLQIIDWLYITKFKYNSIYASLFYYIVCSYLCLDRINYQIINGKKSSSKVDWSMIFCITIGIYYSYDVFTLSLYCLNLPLKVTIPISLYYIMVLVNIAANSTLLFVIFKLPQKPTKS